MSSPKDRLSAIQDTYNDALDNEPHDLAAAQTAAEVTAIQENVARTRNTYYAALAEALTNDGPAVESAFEEAKKALKAVKKAREDSAAIPNLLTKLSSAASAASSLLKAANPSH